MLAESSLEILRHVDWNPGAVFDRTELKVPGTPAQDLGDRACSLALHGYLQKKSNGNKAPSFTITAKGRKAIANAA